MSERMHLRMSAAPAVSHDAARKVSSAFVVDNAGTARIVDCGRTGLSYQIRKRGEGTDRRVGTTSAGPSGPR